MRSMHAACDRVREVSGPARPDAPPQLAAPPERDALLPVPVPAPLPVPVPRPDVAPEVEERLSDVDAWGRSERARRVARRAFDPVYRRWFRADWEGLEHIPRDGGALLVANHAGAVPPDAPVIMHGIETELGRPVYGLGDAQFRSAPFVGLAWSRLGGVVGHPDNAYRLLHDDRQLVLVFPEGTKGPGKAYGERYRLQRFGRGGFVEIAMRAGVPVVPIAVTGTEEAMPTLASFPTAARALGLPYLPLTANLLAFGPLLGPLGGLVWFPSRVRLRVLEPMHFPEAPDQARYPRSRIMEAAEDVRLRIQRALHEMLAERRSAWR